MSHAAARTRLIVAAAIFALSGCITDNPNPPPTPAAPLPPDALKDIKDSVEPTKSANQGLLDALKAQPGNYYLQVRVRAAAVPADPRECLEQSLGALARQLFFQNGKSGLVFASVTYNDPTIPPMPMQSPILTITYDETATSPNDRCYTNAFNGYITPLVRADPTLNFTISFKTKYSANANVTAADQVFQLASVASTAFSGGGLVDRI